MLTVPGPYSWRRPAQTNRVRPPAVFFRDGADDATPFEAVIVGPGDELGIVWRESDAELITRALNLLYQEENPRGGKGGEVSATSDEPCPRAVVEEWLSETVIVCRTHCGYLRVLPAGAEARPERTREGESS